MAVIAKAQALILKRAAGSRPSGDGRMTTTTCSPMVLSSAASTRVSEDRTLTHGYEATREAAMAAFVKSWRWD
jgi:hypothetical protein